MAASSSVPGSAGRRWLEQLWRGLVSRMGAVPSSLVTALYCGVLAALACRLLLAGVHRLQGCLLAFLPAPLTPLVGAVMLLGLLRLVSWPLQGTGTDAYILAMHGRMPPLGMGAALAKLVATVMSIGAGGSGGLAGPALFIGAGLGQSWRSLLPQHGQRPRQLQLMGAASLLAALLGAPLAAAFLACEVLYRRSLRVSELPAALLAAYAGHFSYRWMGGYQTSTAAVIPAPNAQLIVASTFTAALASLWGILLVIGLRWAVRHQQPRGGWSLPGGALLLGLVAWLGGSMVLGWGVPALMQDARGPAGTLPLWLAPTKALATLCTVGSGGSGGLIGPALVMGGWTGQAVAGLGTTLAPPALMWAGMAASLTAISNVPLAAGIFILESFGLGAWPYALIGSGVGFFLARSWVAYAALNVTPEDQRGQ